MKSYSTYFQLFIKITQFLGIYRLPLNTIDTIIYTHEYEFYIEATQQKEHGVFEKHRGSVGRKSGYTDLFVSIQ